MTFSRKTRLELARILPQDPKTAVWELAAMARVENGIDPARMRVSMADDEFSVALGHPAVARKVYLLLKGLGACHTVRFERRRSQGHVRGYLVKATPLKSLLAHVDEVIGVDLYSVGLPENDDHLRAYLRGAYLARGSLSTPAKTYHMEIAIEDPNVAESVVAAFRNFDLEPRISRRKGTHVVYLKESEGIGDALRLMGAYAAVLELENVRIVKGMRNRVNRLVNCETANVDKTVNAAVEQLDAIRAIASSGGWPKLPPAWRELAELRLQHPYASFRELGELLSPKVSKSGVSYRMGRIVAMAKEMSKDLRQEGNHESRRNFS